MIDPMLSWMIKLDVDRHPIQQKQNTINKSVDQFYPGPHAAINAMNDKIAIYTTQTEYPIQ